MTDQALSDLLRDRGQRVTSQRLVINRFLDEHEGHLTAEQVLAGVADALPGTALPTVYATLELFEELGAAISMGLSEGLSDDGTLTGRGSSLQRGLITGGATFVGGTVHSLPFLIHNRATALTVAYCVVACELIAIALIRKRYLNVSLPQSLIQVTLGGVMVAGVGVLIGQG